MEANNASDEEFTNIFIKTGRLQYLIMALIMSGFIIFGQQFINIWAGTNYCQVYAMACILMVPVTVPLIQNVGLSILQSKNKYKFRTIVFFGIAIINVLISIPLAKTYGGMGSAIGTAISLILGQIIILNVYYYKEIHINIPKFWKEILKMTIPVLVISVLGYIVNYYTYSNSLIVFGIKIICYAITYAITVWNFSMNVSEKNIIKLPVKKILKIV